MPRSLLWMSQFTGRAALAASIVGAVAAMSACGDDPIEEAPSASAEAETPAHQVRWLELKSEISPEQWLASRGNASPRAVSDPEVTRLASLLENANRIYRESPRMIANRAVQIEDMLKSHGIEEPATKVLEDLAAVAGEVGQTEGFGAISQHYVNLRMNGHDRAAVLATLKSRYGPRG